MFDVSQTPIEKMTQVPPKGLALVFYAPDCRLLTLNLDSKLKDATALTRTPQ